MDWHITRLTLPAFCRELRVGLASWVGKHTRISVVLATIGFVIFVIGASVYANALVWDFFTNLGLPKGMGAHVSLVGTLVQYDAGHYVHIAQAGYTDIVEAAFLPLYSMLMHLVAALSHLSYEWSGLIISWLTLCAAAVVIYQWASFELRERNLTISPWSVLGLIALFPTALFFVLPYTESLFVLLSVCAILLYRREHYVAATAAAALASATRYQGLVLGVFFLVDYIFNTHNRSWKKFLPVLGAGAGMAAYVVYLYFHFGSPFAFLTAEHSWNRLSGNILISLITSFRPIHLWFVAVLAAGLVSAWKYLGKAYFAYCLVFIALPLASGRFDSFNRYMLSMVPMFLGLAILGAQKAPSLLRLAYICSSAFLLAWSIMLFANGYWVA